MKTIDLSDAKKHAVLPAAGRSLNVVAICDGLLGVACAHEAVEALGQVVAQDTLVRTSYWSFDSLQPLDVQHLNMRLAAHADLLIVSAPATAALPANVRSWIMAVMRESREDAPVIAAFHPDAQGDPQAASPMCEFLSGVASLWHTDFLCHESFDRRLDRGLVQDLLHHPRHKDRPVEWSVPMAQRGKGFHWGIPA